MNSYALIVEPDPDLASSHAEIFSRTALTPVLVLDGEAAIDTLIERGAPGLLITELSLPRMNGFELIEQLRRTQGGSRTPVVVVAASRELRNEAIERRASLGIGAILATAASSDSLRRVVTRLLEDSGEAPPIVDPESLDRDEPSSEQAAAGPEMFAAGARATGVRLRETNIRMSAESTRRNRGPTK